MAKAMRPIRRPCRLLGNACPARRSVAGNAAAGPAGISRLDLIQALAPMPEITLLQAITLAIAAVGAVLGIINAWCSVDQSRVKLKVVPTHAIPYGAANPNLRFCVQVTNLSEFAVTIDDVGVFYRGTGRRGSIVNPIFADNGPWPRRLEPRTSISIYSELPRSLPGHEIKCAFARTQCGRTKTGTSPALTQIVSGR
jgi:hypothetical protein